MKKIYFIIFAIFLSFSNQAQNTNNVWAFGFGNGVDFNTTPPTPVGTRCFSLEGSASISDASGQLLMYAAGDTVYNRNHIPMPNGSGILNLSAGGFGFLGSCTQGCVIVPRPGNPSQYYVFAIEGISDGILTGRLFYSLVDMTLDGGLGDVVAGQKCIQIDTLLQEKMTTVAGDCNNIWLVVRSQDAFEYHSFQITAAGVSTTPVISTINNPPFDLDDYTAGVIKFSHDGNRMVSANLSFNDMQYGVELYDFNKATGILDNPMTISYNGINIDFMATAYGACFSPDDTKLYITEFVTLKQYDVSLPTAAAIANSVVLLDTVDFVNNIAPFGDIQLAPNNKLYVARNFQDIISSIEQPNTQGLGCNYVNMAIDLSTVGLTDMSGAFGLPNDVVNPVVGNQDIFIHDTTICDTFYATSSLPDESYIWNTGATTATIAISQSGTYWVKTLDGCGTIDTFHVTVDSVVVPTVNLNDTVICSAPVTSLDITANTSNVNNTTSYNWQPSGAIINSQGNNATVNPTANEKIYLTVTNSKGSLCTASQTDSMSVSFIYISQLLEDETICKGDPINVSKSVQVPPSAQILWSNGATQSSTNFNESGNQWVQIIEAPCVATDSFSISVIECNCQPLLPNAFSPNGDGMNDYFSPLLIDPSCLQNGGYFVLDVFNRWGELVYEGIGQDKGWDGTYNGKPADVGIYFYYFKYKLGLNGIEGYKKGDLVLLK